MPDSSEIFELSSSEQEQQVIEKDKETPTQDMSNEIIDSLDKDIFFSVAIAKKKTNAVLKKKIEVSMLPIYDKINSAINNGQFFIESILTVDQKSFLAKRNFWITCVRQDGLKTIYKIRWD